MKLSFPVSATITRPRWLVDAEAGWRSAAFPVRYGLLERADGVVLIDTGYSPELFAIPGLLPALYRAGLGPRLDPANDAVAAVERLGGRAQDVRHIILTHLHADHVCGLRRFPKATLHLSRQSLALWAAPASAADHKAGFFRALMPPLASAGIEIVGDAPSRPLPWGGFGHDIFGDGSALSVDLPGHMTGHFGVLFPRLEQPLFYAVDADWTKSTLMSGRRANWPMRIVMHDVAAAMRSAEIVRQASQHADIVLCHDPEPVL